MERGGYSSLAFATWLRPRAAMRRLLEIRPREAVILAFGMVAMLFVFLGRVPGTLRLAQEGGWSPEAMVSAQFVTLVLFAPLFLYGVAALVRLAFRATGGRGDWYGTRLAFFWTLMVTAPAHGLAVVAAHPAPSLAAGLAALWILGGCLGEAEGVAAWRAALVALGTVGALLGLAFLVARA